MERERERERDGQLCKERWSSLSPGGLKAVADERGILVGLFETALILTRLEP
jgi:hypothetical protein